MPVMSFATESELFNRRAAMVETQLRRRGIRDPHVLEVFHEVPRHEFVQPEDIGRAYEDHPLPIGEGQTISQPYMVALMTEALALTEEDTVLEIGTGSGYQVAVLSRLAGYVHTMEWFADLSAQADERLQRLGYDNVTCLVGDGSEGHPPSAPYDAILVTAAAPEAPQTLLDQLAEDGRLVIPVGGLDLQDLLLLRKRDGVIEKANLTGCRFVPLTGRHGWRTLSTPPN